mmetsp:Transcript_11374/g.18504  ORF Transcript_11374/g.18504 Transcript_11374/m.18504 type:complete len:747 (-) Transcript_11374:245-2485(-)
MEGIKDIVSTIVRGCAQGGIVVPEVLAAFVARTIVEESTDSFSLDKSLTREAKDEVIIQSIERLLEKDSPQLETMKMQVDFDCSFLEQDNEFQKVIRLRKKMVAAARTSIAEMQMGDANDFESLTTLYRKIFRFLMEFAPTEHAVQDRAVEKEVAAALESVFPRIGLKAFVQLTFEEKNVQLMELARIVFGIRLFNRHQNRGGAGIDDVDHECPKLVAVVEKDVSREAEAVSDLCNKYQEVIVKAYLKIRRSGLRKQRQLEREKLEEKRQRDQEDNEEEGQAASEEKGEDKEEEMGDDLDDEEDGEQLADWALERWSFELANRRQYLAFLKSIQEEVAACSSKITELCETIQDELSNLGGLVGGRASVAKEMVYPRFDALASTWITLWEEYNLLKVRNNTYVSLRKFKSSFSCSLTEQVFQDLGSMGDQGADVSLAAGTNGDYDFDDDIDFSRADDKSVSSELGDEKGGDDKPGAVEDKEEEKSPVVDIKRKFSVELEQVSAQGAELLQAHNTPDFMLLPLELQGFCPWTMVHASGLLVPGKPALGVIRYDNMYYVCEHKTAIKNFMEEPEEHLRRIKEQAQRNPEFIHLLRLQNYFPTASIARLIEKPEFDKGGPSHKTTRDAGTSTPTHFVERHIDPNYHWNEWELRRRVLKVVNLKNCSTVSAQTDSSHFRRDGETQVYQPRVKGTQTRRDQGTNPVIRTTFVTGLRGTQPAEAKDVSRHIKPDDPKSDTRNKARVVTLTLER